MSTFPVPARQSVLQQASIPNTYPVTIRLFCPSISSCGPRAHVTQASIKPFSVAKDFRSVISIPFCILYYSILPPAQRLFQVAKGIFPYRLLLYGHPALLMPPRLLILYPQALITMDRTVSACITNHALRAPYSLTHKNRSDEKGGI